MTVVSLRTRKRTHKRSLNLDREQYIPRAVWFEVIEKFSDTCKLPQ